MLSSDAVGLRPGVYRGVVLGEGLTIGPFVLIGVPPAGAGDGEHPTRVGAAGVIRSHTVIYAGVLIGERFQSGHGALVREFSVIGNDVSVGSGSVIEHRVTIGDRVRIHSQAFIPEFSELQDDCWIGPRVVLTNAKYPRSPGVKDHLRGPVVQKRAKIGANATILPGIVVGADALVGAGSVVTQDVPPGAVVVGNPARVVKQVRDLPYEATSGKAE